MHVGRRKQWQQIPHKCVQVLKEQIGQLKATSVLRAKVERLLDALEAVQGCGIIPPRFLPQILHPHDEVIPHQSW